jgi:hypothetical protein
MKQTGIGRQPGSPGEGAALRLPPPPPPEPEPRRSKLGTAWAAIGAFAGLCWFVVPGILALRSLLRWRRGSIPRPTFAWICAWVGVPLFSLAAYSAWALYHVPLVYDDFSDPSSGWPVAQGADWAVGYRADTYRIGLRGPGSQTAWLTWNEGSIPNVAVEADVRVIADEGVRWRFGVGCVSETELEGFVFVIEHPHTYAIWRMSPSGRSSIDDGLIPPGVLRAGTNRIRGVCRAGHGDTTVSVSLNGVMLGDVSAPDDGRYRAFTSVGLLADLPDAGTRIDVMFDDVRAIAVQPS